MPDAPKLRSRLGWFALYWLGGVAVLTVVAFALRWVLS